MPSRRYWFLLEECKRLVYTALNFHFVYHIGRNLESLSACYSSNKIQPDLLQWWSTLITLSLGLVVFEAVLVDDLLLVVEGGAAAVVLLTLCMYLDGTI